MERQQLALCEFSLLAALADERAKGGEAGVEALSGCESHSVAIIVRLGGGSGRAGSLALGEQSARCFLPLVRESKRREGAAEGFPACQLRAWRPRDQ